MVIILHFGGFERWKHAYPPHEVASIKTIGFGYELWRLNLYQPLVHNFLISDEGESNPICSRAREHVSKQADTLFDIAVTRCDRLTQLPPIHWINIAPITCSAACHTRHPRSKNDLSIHRPSSHFSSMEVSGWKKKHKSCWSCSMGAPQPHL